MTSNRDIRQLRERLSRVEEKLDRLCDALGVDTEEKAYASEEGQTRPPALLARPMMYGYEYRSPTTMMGLPLLHIATGVDPYTGRARIAKGWIAIGNIAIGAIALGGIAIGGFCFSGIAFGCLAFGGVGVGPVAAGGVALGYVALGGAAIGYYAIGGGAVGNHVVSASRQDAEAVEAFGRWLPWLMESVARSRQ